MKKENTQKVIITMMATPLKFTRYFLIIAFVATLININSCIEPYDFEPPTASKNFVVDGFITTEKKVHEVMLNYSTGYNAGEKNNPVSGASVRIISDKDEVFYLEEAESGRYITQIMAAEVGTSYKISIDTEGKTYESEFEPTIGVKPFEGIFYEYKEDEFSGSGISVYALNQEPEGESRYSLWDYLGHQKEYFLYLDMDDPEAGEAVYTCISSVRCIDCINISSDKFKSGSRYNQFIAKVPYTSKEKFMMQIKKYSISPNVFEYYSQINRLVNNTGSVFDSPPTILKGNIFNINDRDEIVHGYFYASDMYQEVFTIDRNNFSVPPNYPPPLNPEPCTKSPMACTLYPVTLPNPLPCKTTPPPYWN